MPRTTAKAGAKAVVAVRVAAKIHNSLQTFPKLVLTGEGLWPELSVLAECGFDLKSIAVTCISIRWAACAFLLICVTSVVRKNICLWGSLACIIFFCLSYAFVVQSSFGFLTRL